MKNETAIVPGSSSEIIVNDQVDTSLLFKSVGEDVKDWEISKEPPPHFWKPEENSFVFGVIEGEFEYTTEYGAYKVYCLRLTKPAIGYSNDEKTAEQLEEGDLISVGERTCFRDLAKHVGKEVCVICDGVVKGKKNSYYKIRIAVKK